MWLCPMCGTANEAGQKQCKVCDYGYRAHIKRRRKEKMSAVLFGRLPVSIAIVGIILTGGCFLYNVIMKHSVLSGISRRVEAVCIQCIQSLDMEIFRLAGFKNTILDVMKNVKLTVGELNLPERRWIIHEKTELLLGNGYASLVSLVEHVANLFRNALENMSEIYKIVKGLFIT